MKILEVLQQEFPFIQNRRYWYGISLVLVAVSLVSLLFLGVNQGLDFTGGTSLQLRFEDATSVPAVRSTLAEHGLGRAEVVTVGQESREFLIRMQQFPGDEARDALYTDLEADHSAFEIISLEAVSALISAELTRNAFIALFIAIVGMVLYITFRFEFNFAMAAIATLLHDALITLGVFSLFQLEAGSAFVVALLAIMGYSVNDTIIVFDRIREDLRYRKREPIPTVVNRSVNRVLMRSINTSATTLAALLALSLFGGPAIQELTIALIVGIGLGTFSSVFIASPLWVTLQTGSRSDDRKPAA